jgi:hypothetical protein
MFLFFPLFKMDTLLLCATAFGAKKTPLPSKNVQMKALVGEFRKQSINRFNGTSAQRVARESTASGFFCD